jgi:hypothetical protein
LYTFLDISYGKNGMPLSSISAFTLSGFTIIMKSKFQKIIPTLKISTATPLILFKSRGNCVHKQFNSGIAAIKQADIGIIIQNTTNVFIVSPKFISNGDSKKIKAHILIAFLYPTNREKGFAAGTVRQRGMIAHNISFELVV